MIHLFKKIIILWVENNSQFFHLNTDEDNEIKKENKYFRAFNSLWWVKEERGLSLSGGRKERVNLARCLVDLERCASRQIFTCLTIHSAPSTRTSVEIYLIKQSIPILGERFECWLRINSTPLKTSIRFSFLKA